MNRENFRAAIYGLNSLDDIEALPVTVAYIGEAVPDNWGGQLCDQWRANIGGLSFDYFTGLGLRKRAKLAPPPPPVQSVAYLEWERHYMRPAPPRVADILAALVRDAEAINSSFYDWCADYGYSADSINAWEIYRACLNTGRLLREIFTRAELASIATLTAEI